MAILYMGSILCMLFYLLMAKPQHAYSFLLLVNTVYMNKILGYDFDVFFKMLFLIVSIIFMYKYNVRTKYIFNFYFLIVIFLINYLYAQFDVFYTKIDFFTATIPLITGFLFLLVKLPNKTKNIIIKTVVYLPLFSVVIGILMWPLGICNPFQRGNFIGLSGASESTNLAFYCIIAMAASLFVYKSTKVMKYRYMMYINFIFLFCTLTRGGIIAGFVFIIYDFLPFLTSCFKSKRRLMAILFVFIIAIYPFSLVVSQLMERMFTASGEINSSGRIDAWEIIVNMCRNSLFGNGYGFIKTRTNAELKFFTAAHNEYIHLYTELGYIGAFSFVLNFVFCLKKWIKGKKINAVPMVIAFISFALYSIFDNTITNYHFWMPFMLFVSISDDCNIDTKTLKIMQFK